MKKKILKERDRETKKSLSFSFSTSRHLNAITVYYPRSNVVCVHSSHVHIILVKLRFPS